MKFEIGEIVIINSKARPDLNGEATVLSTFPFDGGVAYMLNDGHWNGWQESALRKRKPDNEELTSWSHIAETIGFIPNEKKETEK